MKKLFLVCFLAMSVVSFAVTSKPAKKVKVKKNKAVACCTVGKYKECGWAWEPLCDRARAHYHQQ